MVERVLLLANYFLVYEYAVVARNYGLGLLLGLLYAMARTSAAPRLFTIALILGVMGNANVYAFVLSGLLALEYAWRIWFGPGRPAPVKLLAAGAL